MAWLLDRVGVEYLNLRRFAEAPGRLDPVLDDLAAEPAPEAVGGSA